MENDFVASDTTVLLQQLVCAPGISDKSHTLDTTRPMELK